MLLTYQSTSVVVKKMKPEWENKEQTVSNEELQILQIAREILSDESKWNSEKSAAAQIN